MSILSVKEVLGQRMHSNLQRNFRVYSPCTQCILRWPRTYFIFGRMQPSSGRNLMSVSFNSCFLVSTDPERTQNINLEAGVRIAAAAWFLFDQISYLGGAPSADIPRK